ncbi:hypothetical protein ACH518_15665 [Methylomonas sp. HW2-6]|uniref:hypothetical protein n=1 Tax=Methylomonas sp. HW2-6 TaxID=3376687 RepID=UPI00404325B8
MLNILETKLKLEAARRPADGGNGGYFRGQRPQQPEKIGGAASFMTCRGQGGTTNACRPVAASLLRQAAISN